MGNVGPFRCNGKDRCRPFPLGCQSMKRMVWTNSENLSFIDS